MGGSAGRNAPAETLGGTILMGSRVYAPGVGRFLSIDPTPGGNANVYDYCTADPVNCSDLTGNWPDWGAVLNVVAVVAEVVATVVPGPIGTAAGFISAGAYLATGNTEKATEMAITATAQLIGAGLAAKAAVKAVQYASKIGRAVTGAVKTARAAVAESRVGRAAERILSKGCNCFIAGTLVDTDHGPVPIEQIQVGDQVWARDLDTGTNELREVVGLFNNKPPPWKPSPSATAPRSSSPKNTPSTSTAKAGSSPATCTSATTSPNATTPPLPSPASPAPSGSSPSTTSKSPATTTTTSPPHNSSFTTARST